MRSTSRCGLFWSLFGGGGLVHSVEGNRIQRRPNPLVLWSWVGFPEVQEELAGDHFVRR